MELKRPKAILFDWDNTLVNTWPIIHDALKKTFIEMGLEPWDMATVQARVSRSMRDSFPLIFGNDWQAAGDLYQQNFRAIHLERLEALPGAADTLNFLSDKPVYVAVVSNKKGDNLRKEVAHISWNHYFKKIIGASDTPRDKPAPEPVEAAMKDSNITLGGDVWFVGDSVIDMECAHVTGCLPVWFGDLPPEPLAYGFKQRAADHTELKKLFASVF